MIRPAMIRPAIVAALALSAASVAGPAKAETAEDEFVRYHGAIEAASLCTDYRFDQQGVNDEDAAWIGEAQDAMGSYIDGQVGGAIGAGDRLHLIERAKGETEAYVGDHGCDDPKVADLLGIFHRELEPLLPPR